MIYSLYKKNLIFLKSLVRKYQRQGELLLFGILPLFFLASCSSRKIDYSAYSTETAPVSVFMQLAAAFPDSSKLKLDSIAAHTVRRLKSLRQEKKNIPPYLLNSLYSTFGAQLKHDRRYLYHLKGIDFSRDTLTSMQHLALYSLLKSAWSYEQTYETSSYIAKKINRGNSSHNIPKNVLREIGNLLYNPVYRSALTRYNINETFSVHDSLLLSLPPVNSKTRLFHKFGNNKTIPRKTLDKITYGGSYLFSSFVGTFEGKYESILFAEKLVSLIEPFDIVLMKSSKNLTDQFIPGFFGHSAIWLGSKISSLNDTVPQDLPTTQSRFMIEALRSGVKMSNLEEFATGEVFLILRPISLTPDQKYSIQNNALLQLGKGYDYYFDAETSDLISCTELIYLAYDFIPWQGKLFLGRHLLAPDDILTNAIQSGKMYCAALIIGDETHVNPDTILLQTIMLTDYPME
jgi:hypothetical protein